MRDIRVALPDSEATPRCVLEEALPAHNCTPVNMYLNMTLVIGRMLFGSSAKFRVVNASGWSFTTKEIGDPDDFSVMGLIEKVVMEDLADVTPPVMNLMARRTARARYTRIVHHGQLCFVYRRLSVQHNALSIDRLCWEPRGVWALLIVTFLLRLIVSRLTQLLVFRGKNSPMWKLEVQLRWRDRTNVFLHLIYGLSLALLTKYLFIVFEDISGFEERIRTAEDLIASMMEGQHRLITGSQAYVVSLNQISGLSSDVVERAKEITPPVVEIEAAKIRDTMASDSEDVLPNHVYLGSRREFLALGLPRPCDYVQECNPSTEYSIPHVVYYSRSAPLRRLTIAEVTLFNSQLSRLYRHYYSAASTARCGGGYEADYVLVLSQIQGLMASFAIAFAVCISCFCAERFLLRKYKDREPSSFLPKKLHPRRLSTAFVRRHSVKANRVSDAQTAEKFAPYGMNVP